MHLQNNPSKVVGKYCRSIEHCIQVYLIIITIMFYIVTFSGASMVAFKSYEKRMYVSNKFIMVLVTIYLLVIRDNKD